MLKRSLGTGSVLALWASALMATLTPASAVSPPGSYFDSEDRASSSERIIDLPFSHPVDAKGVQSLRDDISVRGSGVKIVAVRYSNPGITGEIFKVDETSITEFVSAFQNEFDATPAFIGFVAKVDRGSSNSTEQLVRLLSSEVSMAEPESLDPESVSARLSEVQRHGTAMRSGLKAAGSVKQIAPWAPGPYTYWRGYNEGDQAVMELSSAWLPYEGFDARALPEHFGMEVEFNFYNDNLIPPTIPPAIRPNCGYDPNDPKEGDRRYLDDFWAARYNSSNDGIDSWSILTEAGSQIDHKEIGFYWDWTDIFDSCDRQSIAVGIAHPGNIPENSAGVKSFRIEIRAPRGWPASSPMSGLYQAVFNSCEYSHTSDGAVKTLLPLSPSSACMGTVVPAPEVPNASSSWNFSAEKARSLPGCYNTYNQVVDGEIVSSVEPCE